jgi:hypothetical protein
MCGVADLYDAPACRSPLGLGVTQAQLPPDDSVSRCVLYRFNEERIPTF